MKKTLIICLLSTCIFTGAWAQSQNYATVILYRPGNFVAALVSYGIDTAAKAEVYKAKNNSKAEVKVYHEGDVTFFSDTRSKAYATVDVKFGKTYYIRCDELYSEFGKNPKMQVVPEALAKKDADKIKE